MTLVTGMTISITASGSHTYLCTGHLVWVPDNTTGDWQAFELFDSTNSVVIASTEKTNPGSGQAEDADGITALYTVSGNWTLQLRGQCKSGTFSTIEKSTVNAGTALASVVAYVQIT